MRIRRTVVALCAPLLALGSGAFFAMSAGAASPWNTTPLPFTAAGPIQGSFAAVSCMNATECVAAGKATLPGGSGDTGPFVANLVSGSWVQGLLPLPSGASTASLTAISCTSSKCRAVGTYTTGQTHALIETFSGGTWTATTAVDPSGVTAASLAAVSCSSASSCTAVGNDSAGAFAVVFASSSWTPTALTMPAGDTAPTLAAVSCIGSESCDAVGSVTTASGTAALIESENAATWTASTDAIASGARLTSVGCNTDETCEAGASTGESGFFESFQISGGPLTEAAGAGGAISSLWCTSSGSLQCTAWGDVGNATVIQALSSGTWGSEGTSGLPQTEGQPEGSCSTQGSCFAFESISTEGVEVLTETGSTSPWSGSVLPGPPASTLSQVSCTSQLCAAVGTYYDDTGLEHTMLESLSRGTWTEQAFTAVATSYVDSPSISCQGKTCVLVEGDTVAVNSGSGWSTTTLPEPSGDTYFLDFGSVSCVSAQWCVAVGTLLGFGDNPVIETYSGGTWTAQKAPLPSGGFGSLEGVDCASKTFCVAVGAGNGSSGGIQSWVETLSGSTWAAAFLPPASGASFGELRGVSCPATGSCTAVGSWYPTNGGSGDPLVTTLSGGLWTESELAPSGGAAYGSLNSVGCTGANKCSAVEDALSGSGTNSFTLQKLGAREVAVPLPAGASSVSPQAISCQSSGWCTLAGYYDAPFSASPGTASYPMIASSGAPPIGFTSAPKAHAVVGEPFNFEVQTTSTPGDALAAIGLPSGFSFADSGNGTGIISGTATPGEIGTTDVTVNAANGVVPPASQTLKLRIQG